MEDGYRYLDSDMYFYDGDYDDAQLQENYVYYDEQFEPAEVIQARVEYFSFSDELSNLVKNCMGTVLFQSADQTKTLLSLCLVFRLVCRSTVLCLPSQSKLLHPFLHLASVLFGLLSLHSINSANFGTTVFIMALYVFSTFILFKIFVKVGITCGRFVSIVTALYLITGEMSISSPKHWHQIRGVLMLLAMKSISVAFDIDSKRILKPPNLIDYAGYCFHCGTLLFGPWVSYEHYVDSVISPKPVSFIWAKHVVKSLIYAFACLLLSTCVLSYLFIEGSQPELPSLTPLIANHWMLSYKTAISFHFSHFYICYIAQTTCLLSGVGSQPRSSESIWSELTLTHPLSVEFPVSMLNVVVAWNVAMSKWLKEYVFNAYRSFGRSTAVLLTYAASAMLHGLSFHLAAVLLSLGLYTYVEYSLRMKFSQIFDCVYIRARPKPSEQSSKMPMWAYAFNFAWVLINLMHLAYLGAMFESEDETVAQEGYPMKHTLEKWANLGFFSHGFALFCLIINYFI